MLISTLAGTILAAGVVACPPGSEPSEANFVLPQVGQVVLRPVALAEPGQVKMSEAPYGDLYTNAWLNKTWVSTPAGATLKEFTSAICRATERETFVDWERLTAAGMKEDTKIAVPLNHVHLEQALRIVNERIGGQVAVRRTGDLVEVSTRDAFDRRERRVVAYDLRELLAENREARTKQLIKAITTTVEPEAWADNGGDTARITSAEGRLFVTAPPRVQKAVAWMFGQVSDKPIAGVEQLHQGEPVQMLQIEPVQINRTNSEVDELRAQIRGLRRELAWKKVMLGQELTADDREAMDDNRAVHAVGGPSGPSKEAVEQEANTLAVKLADAQTRLAVLESRPK